MNVRDFPFLLKLTVDAQQIKGTRIMRFVLIDRNKIAVDLYFLFKHGFI